MTRVEQLTEQAELLDGRVKTLHPMVFAGILARRDKAEDMASLREQGIAADRHGGLEPVPVPLGGRAAGACPRTRCSRTSTSAGPSMVRAAAKNHHAVAVVTEPERYGFLLDELRSRGGELSADTRRELAARRLLAHRVVRRGDRDLVHRHRAVPGAAHARLPQGHRPRLRREPAPARCVLRDAGARRNLLSRVEQHGGPQLSFNNLGDLQAARTLAAAFQVPAVVIIKHAIPSGVAVGASPGRGLRRARSHAILTRRSAG